MKGLHKLASLAGIALMTASIQAQAAFSDDDARASSGTIACGGSHFNRLGGTEAHRTRYILRNYGENPVRIERVVMYDANAAVLYDSLSSGLPAFDAVLGAGNNVLGPNQTALLRSENMLGSSLPQNERPIQVIFEWSADRRTIIPDIVLTRTTLRREEVSPGVFAGRETRGRHLNNCRRIR